MRRWLLFLPLLIFIVLGSIFYVQLDKNNQYMPSALIDKSVPEFSLVSLNDDKIVTNQDMSEGPYIINFWGTWCPACHIEHPFLISLAQAGIKIIGIDYKDQRKPARQWLEEKGDPYQKVLMDEIGHFGLDMGVTGAPESFLVNTEGVIVYRHQGELNAHNWQEIKHYLDD